MVFADLAGQIVHDEHENEMRDGPTWKRQYACNNQDGFVKVESKWGINKHINKALNVAPSPPRTWPLHFQNDPFRPSHPLLGRLHFCWHRRRQSQTPLQECCNSCSSFPTATLPKSFKRHKYMQTTRGDQED